MPIKFKNMNMGFIKGDVPLKSVMIGTKCVYGFDFTAFKILYPSIPKGTGFYIDVNGSRKLREPTTSGELEVHYGDRIIVRTYAEIGYENPVSSVVACGNPIIGTDYAINIDGIRIKRSTTYEFIVKGDSGITLSEAVPAPKINISVDKDTGIDTVSIYYMKGPYGYSGLNDSSLDATESLFTTADDTIQMYLYSKISSRNSTSVAKEGYKVVSTTKNYIGLLTVDNQCTVEAVSQAGTKVSIVCPPIINGVTEYALNMISSEYSRNINNIQFYSQTLSFPSQTSFELSQRNNNYYFYKGDTIKITAKRKDGFKLPSLGKQGETISQLVTSKQIVLSDANVLVVESGAQGVPVLLVNEKLNTTEYALLNVTSDFTDSSYRVRSTQIYVGDKITVPLSPDYRVGTRYRRKPGVGFMADGKIFTDITFSNSVTVNVPNTSVLTVILQQGAQRSSYSQFTVNPVATFSRATNISSMQIDYRSIRGDYFTPDSAYGPEEYFLETFDMTYSCKRYWLDAVMSKYNKFTQYNVPSNFSYEYDCDIWPTKVVIAGAYNVNSDGKGVTLTVSKYDTDWVANSSDQAKLIPRTIII